MSPVWNSSEEPPDREGFSNLCHGEELIWCPLLEKWEKRPVNQRTIVTNCAPSGNRTHTYPQSVHQGALGTAQICTSTKESTVNSRGVTLLPSSGKIKCQSLFTNCVDREERNALPGTVVDRQSYHPWQMPNSVNHFMTFPKYDDQIGTRPKATHTVVRESDFTTLSTEQKSENQPANSVKQKEASGVRVASQLGENHALEHVEGRQEYQNKFNVHCFQVPRRQNSDTHIYRSASNKQLVHMQTKEIYFGRDASTRGKKSSVLSSSLAFSPTSSSERVWRDSFTSHHILPDGDCNCNQKLSKISDESSWKTTGAAPKAQVPPESQQLQDILPLKDIIDNHERKSQFHFRSKSSPLHWTTSGYSVCGSELQDENTAPEAGDPGNRGTSSNNKCHQQEKFPISLWQQFTGETKQPHKACKAGTCSLSGDRAFSSISSEGVHSARTENPDMKDTYQIKSQGSLFTSKNSTDKISSTVQPSCDTRRLPSISGSPLRVSTAISKRLKEVGLVQNATLEHHISCELEEDPCPTLQVSIKTQGRKVGQKRSSNSTSKEMSVTSKQRKTALCPKKTRKESKDAEKIDYGDVAKCNVASGPIRLKKVAEMSENERDMLLTWLTSAQEVALTVVYSDGSTQLRPKDKGRKKENIPDAKVAGVAVALPVTSVMPGSRNLKSIAADSSKPPLSKPANINKLCGSTAADTSKLCDSEEMDTREPQVSKAAHTIMIKPLISMVADRSKPHVSMKHFILPFHFVDQKLKEWVRELLSQLMCGKLRKVCYGAQELIKMLTLQFGFNQHSVIQDWHLLDPQVAGWLLDPDNSPSKFTDILVQFPKLKQSLVSEPDDQICEDLDLLGPVMLGLYQKLMALDMWALFCHLEMSLSPILAMMELRGICMDTKHLIDMGDKLKWKLQKLESSAHKEAGHPFVINSHQQLRQVLFEELQLDQKLPQKSKIARTSVSQQKSTSESVLSQLQDLHPLPKIVLQYRQKLKSTYVDGMLACVKDDVLKTHWEHKSAATGRLASSNPNIQAIPKQPVVLTQANFITASEDKLVELNARDAFISPDGWSFLAADFQQIEFRLLAHLASDEALLKLFSDSQCLDVFSQLTSQWLSKPVGSITMQEREQTKRVVYSVMYGVGKERLGEYLKIGPNEAKSVMDSFLVRFPAVNSFSRICVDKARNEGCLTTIFKRRRLFPHITHSSYQLRAQAERQAVNFCIQAHGCRYLTVDNVRLKLHAATSRFSHGFRYLTVGSLWMKLHAATSCFCSAADLCKAAMVQVEQALVKQSQLQARLLIQIHDELLLEVKDEHLDELAALVKGIMEDNARLCGNAVHLRVPLRVSLTTGKAWGHMTKYIVQRVSCTSSMNDKAA